MLVQILLANLSASVDLSLIMLHIFYYTLKVLLHEYKGHNLCSELVRL